MQLPLPTHENALLPTYEKKLPLNTHKVSLGIRLIEQFSLRLLLTGYISNLIDQQSWLTVLYMY